MIEVRIHSRHVNKKSSVQKRHVVKMLPCSAHSWGGVGVGSVHHGEEVMAA